MNLKFIDRKLIVGGLIALVVIGGGGWLGYTKFWRKTNSGVTDQPKKKKISEPVNVIAVDQRPYLQILPVADGRNLDLRIVSLQKPATSLEYELEYQAGSLLQGAFGQIDLNSLPTSKRILLGSCSAGGACTYHQDIKGGTLVGKFIGAENYSLKQDWRYFDNYGFRETQFASKDAKFQIESKD